MKTRIIYLSHLILALLATGGCLEFIDGTSSEAAYSCTENYECLEGFICVQSTLFAYGECAQTCQIDDDCPDSKYCYKNTACVPYKNSEVTINGQTWTAKNMDITTGNDGSKLTCYANTAKDPDFIKNYGCLYTFEDAQKVCPSGWHLPTQTELSALIIYAGGENSTGATNLRASSWGSGADKYGFGALPAGSYYGGNYLNFGNYAYFWSATENEDNSNYAYNLYLDNGNANVYNNHKGTAFSVRCVRD